MTEQEEEPEPQSGDQHGPDSRAGRGGQQGGESGSDSEISPGVSSEDEGRC